MFFAAKSLSIVTSLGMASPVLAQSISIRPIVDLRLRYESVDQDDFNRNADAVTLRSRTGVEASWRDFSVLVENEATLPIVDQFDSGTNGRTTFPLVADPANIELNRLQLRYAPVPKTSLTIGRQLITLDDQRHVGAAVWRQNEQTFDAVRLEYGDAKGLKLDASYAWSVRTIWGVDGAGSRPQAVSGDIALASASHPTPLGIFGVFAIVADQDEATVSGFRLSSQTYGLKLAGSRKLSSSTTVNWLGSFARQTDLGRNPNDYSANFYLGELGIGQKTWSLSAGVEIMGHGNGRPFTSFQTPLARLHRFRGWADKFSITPPNGLRDFYLKGGYTKKGFAGLDMIALTAFRRCYESDRGGLHYGNEWDFQVALTKGKWTLLGKLSDYQADKFAAGTRKFWLQLEWVY